MIELTAGDRKQWPVPNIKDNEVDRIYQQQALLLITNSILR